MLLGEVSEMPDVPLRNKPEEIGQETEHFRYLNGRDVGMDLRGGGLVSSESFGVNSIYSLVK